MRSLTRCAAHAAILTASILGTAVAGLAAGFIETDLVANKSPLTDSNGISHTPAHVDPNLLNPWGLTASSTSPFWVSDNGAGVSTLYDNAGVARSLVVSIPAPPPGDPLGKGGTPTGVVFNIAQAVGAFKISKVQADGTTVTGSGGFPVCYRGRDNSRLEPHGRSDPRNHRGSVERSGLQRSRHRHRCLRNDSALRHQFPCRYGGGV